MLLDQLTMVADGELVTETGTSSGILDLSDTGTPENAPAQVRRDVGGGVNLEFLLTVTETFVGIASLNVALEVSSDIDFSASRIVAATGAIDVLDLERGGARLPVVRIPPGVSERYLRLKYTVLGGPGTEGRISASIAGGMSSYSLRFGAPSGLPSSGPSGRVAIILTGLTPVIGESAEGLYGQTQFPAGDYQLSRAGTLQSLEGQWRIDQHYDGTANTQSQWTGLGGYIREAYPAVTDVIYLPFGDGGTDFTDGGNPQNGNPGNWSVARIGGTIDATIERINEFLAANPDVTVMAGLFGTGGSMGVNLDQSPDARVRLRQLVDAYRSRVNTMTFKTPWLFTNIGEDFTITYSGLTADIQEAVDNLPYCAMIDMSDIPTERSPENGNGDNHKYPSDGNIHSQRFVGSYAVAVTDTAPAAATPSAPDAGQITLAAISGGFTATLAPDQLPYSVTGGEVVEMAYRINGGAWVDAGIGRAQLEGAHIADVDLTVTGLAGGAQIGVQFAYKNAGGYSAASASQNVTPTAPSQNVTPNTIGPLLRPTAGGLTGLTYPANETIVWTIVTDAAGDVSAPLEYSTDGGSVWAAADAVAVNGNNNARNAIVVLESSASERTGQTFDIRCTDVTDIDLTNLHMIGCLNGAASQTGAPTDTQASGGNVGTLTTTVAGSTQGGLVIAVGGYRKGTGAVGTSPHFDPDTLDPPASDLTGSAGTNCLVTAYGSKQVDVVGDVSLTQVNPDGTKSTSIAAVEVLA